jgi:ADP-ribosylation factor GTPase-activating protein 1
MVDNDASEFFKEQREDPLNLMCCDLGTSDAQWASVSHGIYISIGASGAHRSLGVKTSFVLSTTMDSWKPEHLRMMELGGNRRFQDFLREHGVAEDTPIRQKYTTRAAEWYRANLRAEAEGMTPPPPLPMGTGCLPADSRRAGVSASGSDAQALLDTVFAAPASPTSPNGRVKRCRSVGDRAGANGCQYADDHRGAMGLVAAAPTPSRGPFVRVLAANIHRAVKGHSTALMLRRLSSGRMEGYGPDKWQPRDHQTVAVAA